MASAHGPCRHWTLAPDRLNRPGSWLTPARVVTPPPATTVIRTSKHPGNSIARIGPVWTGATIWWPNWKRTDISGGLILVTFIPLHWPKRSWKSCSAPRGAVIGCQLACTNSLNSCKCYAPCKRCLMYRCAFRPIASLGNTSPGCTVRSLDLVLTLSKTTRARHCAGHMSMTANVRVAGHAGTKQSR